MIPAVLLARKGRRKAAFSISGKQLARECVAEWQRVFQAEKLSIAHRS